MVCVDALISARLLALRQMPTNLSSSKNDPSVSTSNRVSFAATKCRRSSNSASAGSSPAASMMLVSLFLTDSAITRT